MTFTKKLVLSSVLAMSCASLSGQSFAEKSENPFAECGIGAGLFSNNETAAIISNIVWDLGSTALTSGVSSPATCAGIKAETAAFIHESYDLVTEDTAKGEGQHLSAMLDLAGCDAAARVAVVSDIRDGFTGLVSSAQYSSQDDVAKSENFYNMVVTKTAGVCGLS